MLRRYNGKESITWLWFGSFWNVRLAHRMHYSWGTTRATFDQWKYRLIIQKENKITQTLCLCDTNTYCIHNMLSTPKAVKWTPRKTNIWKWCKLFLSPLEHYSKKSHKRKAPASVECKMGGKKIKCGIVYPFAAVTRGSNVLSLHHSNSSNCVALKVTGVHTNPQKDAATKPPIQGRKSTVIC